MEYIHLDYHPVDFFVTRLHTRLRQSSSEGLRRRFALWDPQTHGESAIAVVTKIEMLNRVAERLNDDLAELVLHLRTIPDMIEQCLNERRALRIPTKILWTILVDVDAFLFEARSTYELLGKFLGSVFRLLFERDVSEQQTIEAMRGLGIDMNWVPVLRESRKLFFHNTALWLAIERTSSNPAEFDVLVLKRNVEVLADGDFLHFRECRRIQSGLWDSIKGISLWIVNEIANVEHEEELSQL